VLSFQKKKKRGKEKNIFLKKILVYLLSLPSFHLIQIKPIDLDGRLKMGLHLNQLES
jgi:hypothetical protein